jgi:ABC-type antimicrobial peptide transport system permease subunit
MGSIVDREKEIFTYSALGLSPPDVGMLFFAESAIYSVIGGMGGYLFSQVVAKLLSLAGHLGIFTPPEMNFSSLSSILTILIVMLVVMLSTIYPALKAGKSANPGVARKWRMPPPRDNQIEFCSPSLFQV